MPFETLKRSHLKRNIIIGVIVVAIISAIILNFTKAKYRVTQSIPLVNGTINYSPGDLIISAYFNDELLETFPTKDSGYIVESITCDKGASATFNEDIWEIEVTNLVTKGTKCDVTFIEKISAKDTILANYPNVLTRNNFSVAITNTTTGTIYKSLDETQYDNDGEVYYFAGAPTDNWVKFGGFYWRIIKINGNSSIRMIYQGKEVYNTGSDTQIEDNIFNNFYESNMYVGFKYSSNEVHGTESNSSILKTLNTWYTNNLENYDKYIDKNSGFCNDRIPSTSRDEINNQGGTRGTVTYYASYIRLRTNKKPTFSCENNNDLFTSNEGSKGNKALQYPIGLITADEVAFAGGGFSITNTDYYLYTRQSYWTMSPSNFGGDRAQVFTVNMYDGDLDIGYVNNIDGIRPVINLKADVKLIGTGTTSDPYRIEGAE